MAVIGFRPVDHSRVTSSMATLYLNSMSGSEVDDEINCVVHL